MAGYNFYQPVYATSADFSHIPWVSAGPSNIVGNVQQNMNLQAVNVDTNVVLNNYGARITPFFRCGSDAPVPLRNALGLVGGILISDENIDGLVRMSGFLTLFSIMNKGDLLTPSNIHDFRECGYDPTPIHIATMQDLYNRMRFSYPASDLAFKELLGVVDEDFITGYRVYINIDMHKKFWRVNNLNYSFDYTIVLCGVYYFISIKRNDRCNFNRRLSSIWWFIANRLGSDTYFHNFLFYPSEKAARYFQEVMHNMFSIRREVFRIITLTYYDTTGEWCTMCSALLDLLRYFEMVPMRIINKHVFVENSFIITYPVVKSEVEWLFKVLKDITRLKIPDSNLPYLKLLYSHHITNSLGTGYFRGLAYIANRIKFGESFNRKYDDYYTSDIDRKKLDQLADIALNNGKLKYALYEESQRILAPYRDMIDEIADPHSLH